MSNDLISRENLKKKLQYVYSCDYIDSKSKEGIVSDIIDEIDNAPTINAFTFEQAKELVELNQQFAQEIESLKKQQGKWIPLNSRFGNLDRYMCSICGHEIRCLPSDLTKYKGCYCGADMRGDEE